MSGSLSPMLCLDCGRDTEDEYFTIQHELWCRARLEGEKLARALELLHEMESLRGASWDYSRFSSTVEEYSELVGGFLCVGCVEARIGRRLTPSDFPAAPVNHPSVVGSDRLWARVTGQSATERPRRVGER